MPTSGRELLLRRTSAPRTRGIVVAVEDRRGGQADLVPAEVGEDVLADVGHALAGHEREGEGRVDQGPAELGLSGVVVVEVDRAQCSG